MSGKNNITVRKQKIRKNHTKAKLVFFLVLTALLLFVAAFAKYLCPYDPYAQDLALAQKPPGLEHLLGTDRYGRDMLSHTVHNVLMACCFRRWETDCLDFCQTVCLLWICQSDL